MATVPADVEQPSDAELIASVRDGAIPAYGELYQRHVASAYNLARQLARSPAEADDLVADAFAKVLDMLRTGKGPQSAFRPYLLTALRHTAYDKTRRDRRVELADDVTGVAPAAKVSVPFSDTAVAGLERSLAATAFRQLPERWQAVLWHTEIEGQSPAEVAPLLGISANGVSALAYRAREGLRQAYLQAHLARTGAGPCRDCADRLGAWLRGGLGRRERVQVEAHLDGCDRCRSLAAELSDVNGALRAVVAPVVLGVAATGYLAATGGVAKATATGVAAAAAGGASGAASAATAGPRQVLGVAASAAALAAAIVAGAVANTAQQQVTAATQPPAPSATTPAPAPQPPPASTPPAPTSPPATTTPPAPTTPSRTPATPSPTSASPAPPPAQPSLTAHASPVTLLPGETQPLRLTVHNGGDAASPPPTVTLHLPPGVTVTGPGMQPHALAAPAATGANDIATGASEVTCPVSEGNTARCTAPDALAPGRSVTLVFPLHADPTARGGTVTGTVTAGSAISVRVSVRVEVQPPPERDGVAITTATARRLGLVVTVIATVQNAGETTGPVAVRARYQPAGDDCTATPVDAPEIAVRPGQTVGVSMNLVLHCEARNHPLTGTGSEQVTVTATLGSASVSQQVPVSTAFGSEWGGPPRH